MTDKNVYIGKGKLASKGVYAARDFRKDEVVKYYNLELLSEKSFNLLPESEKIFVHSFWGKMYLFPEPSRYTNHSPTPNTRSDLIKMCDYAVRPIKKGEMITTNATLEVIAELKTFVESIEGTSITSFNRVKGGYRNAEVVYRVNNKSPKRLVLKRIDGNWRVIK